MARAKVSRLIRVRQGRNYIEFELDEDTGKLIIYITTPGDTTPKVKASLNVEAVNVLRAMLEDGGAKPAKLATELPAGTTREIVKVPADSDQGDDFKAGMA